jgi:excisionase family DNA binding protein
MSYSGQLKTQKWDQPRTNGVEMRSEIVGACIGINHLAERLGLSRRTVHRILARGELPSIRIGRRRLVRLSDLRRWLASYEEPTPGANVTNLHSQFGERTALR